MRTTNELVKQAEMAVIGAIIIDENLLSRIVDKIKIEDFFHTELQEIYKSILHLSNTGKSIGCATVLNQLSKDDLFVENDTKTYYFFVRKQLRAYKISSIMRI